jgi:hypothetical protein
MNPTELLITAYDGDRALFTTSLTPEKASIILTSTDADGETIVGEAFDRTTQVFEPIVGMLVDLASPISVA